MKRIGIAIVCATFVVTAYADGRTSTSAQTTHPLQRFSQRTLLKNWALSACLARIATSPADRDDAGATASAYLEFGKQPIESYDAIRPLIDRFVARKYGSRPEIDTPSSEYNTMKCIDLFHSKELDKLVRRQPHVK
ncbi:T6SS amidase immunity protein Tai4 family protein [Cupriavidus campinensis]